MTALENLGIVGTVLALVVLIVIARAWQKRREEALRRAASMLGFTFVGKARSLPIADLKRFRLMRRGGTVDELMRGQLQGRAVFLFRYVVVVHYGHGASITYWRVAAFWSQALLPPFQVTPHNWITRLKHALTHRDIIFENHPEVARHFYITSGDPQATRNFFDDQVLSQLTAVPSARFTTEASGNWLLVYAHGRANLKPEMIPGFLQQAEDLARIFFDRRTRAAAGAVSRTPETYYHAR